MAGDPHPYPHPGRSGKGRNLLRELLGSGPARPLRVLLRPFRPVAASLGLADPLPKAGDDLAGWSTAELLTWYVRKEVSGDRASAQLNGRRLIDDPRMKDRALFLGLGDILLRRGETSLAVEAFLKSQSLSRDACYHYGQFVFDYLHGRTPTVEALTAIASMAATPRAMVPDLAKLVLRLLWESEAADKPEGQALIRTVAAACDRSGLLDLGNAALAGGGHTQALDAYGLALEQDSHDVLTRLQMGVTQFLAGRYREAEQHFAVMESVRRLEQSRWGVAGLPVTVMHATWTQAIGHIACLDTYVKSMEMGWLPKQRSVLAFDTRMPPIGWPLLKYWGEHIEVVGAPEDPAVTTDAAIWGKASNLVSPETDRRRAALMSSFWCGPNAEGRVRWYGPLGSEVQQAWKAAGRGPVLSVPDEERALFRLMLEQAFGLPLDAWFVLLHVREAGYKQQWETAHAYTRNADIETYDAAIQHIVNQGGWVIRGGDPSMRPIAPRANVIDYATSPLRSPEIDILLCAECRFFLGTNSGFSLVPPLFGRRCALTNWSPLGTPNWYPDDLFIPKLVRRRGGDFLTFEEMYATSAGWSQFQRDFTGEYEKLDNSPEDLLAATVEMLDDLDGRLVLDDKDQARQVRFADVTRAGGGYVGSRLGVRFAERYEQLL